MESLDLRAVPEIDSLPVELEDGLGEAAGIEACAAAEADGRRRGHLAAHEELADWALAVGDVLLAEHRRVEPGRGEAGDSHNARVDRYAAVFAPPADGDSGHLHRLDVVLPTCAAGRGASSLDLDGC